MALTRYCLEWQLSVKSVKRWLGRALTGELEQCVRGLSCLVGVAVVSLPPGRLLSLARFPLTDKITSGFFFFPAVLKRGIQIFAVPVGLD